MSKTGLALAFAVLALPVSAKAAGDDPTCRNGLFAAEAPFTLASIKGEDRAYFFEDTDGCPVSGDDCRTDSYVVPGDTLIVSKLRGKFACVFYAPSQSAGWLRLARLQLESVDPNPPAFDWAGNRERAFAAESSMILPQENGGLRILGSAFWPAQPVTR